MYIAKQNLATNESEIIEFITTYSFATKELSVPTWNYVAVHAYGEAVLITLFEEY